MNYFVWNVHPEIFRIGFFALRWYSVLFAMGFMFGYSFWKKFCAWENKPSELVDANLSYLVIGTVLGARLGHVLFYEPGEYLSNPLRILKVWEGGLASHGALIGVFVSLFLLSRKYKQSFLWLADRNTIPAMLAATLIRIGNVFNSEIIGRESDVPWAVIFARVDQLPRHPTQIYEAAGYFALFLFLYFYYRRAKFNPVPGRLLGWTLVLGLSHRIFIEFFKENQVEFESGMFFNMGQLLSLPLLGVGIFLLLADRGTKNQSKTPNATSVAERGSH